MTKTECISFLKKTKNEYNSKLLRVNCLLNTSFSNGNITEINKENSMIGKWIYEESAQAKDICGNLFYKQAESLHLSWCEDFNKIVEVYSKSTKKGFLFKKKIDDFSKDKIKAYLDDLQNTTQQLKLRIDKILMRISALPDSKFL